MLLSLIAQIYDAAVDPTLWDSVLQQISTFCGAAKAVIFVDDVENPGQTLLYSSFRDPEWLALYCKSFILANPSRLAVGSDARFENVAPAADAPSKMDEGRAFAREFLATRGLVEVAAALRDAASTQVTVLSALRHADQGVVDYEVRSKLQMLVPHVQRAVHIGHVLEQKAVETSGLSEALDALGSAVVLVDGMGTILHANRHANDLIRQDLLGRKERLRLAFNDPEAAAALSRALRAAAMDDASSAAPSAIPLTLDRKRKFIATVIPLKSTASRPVLRGRGAVAAVRIREVAFDPSAAKSTVGPLYGLTRRELAILFAIVEIGGVPAVAAALSLAETTVQTHLKSIFRKTGATRQVDLVKLVAGVAG